MIKKIKSKLKEKMKKHEELNMKCPKIAEIKEN